MQPSGLGRRMLSTRSNRSSMSGFPEQPEASFNPNFYKYYESDGGYSSGGGGAGGRISAGPKTKFKTSLSRSGFGPGSPPRTMLRQKSSFENSSVLPEIPVNGRSGKVRQEWMSPGGRSDNPIENLGSPVRFGTPGDTVMIESDRKAKGTLPPLPRKPPAPEAPNDSDALNIEEL